MADRVAKTALFDGLVTAAKALASGRRAEIIDVLAQGERSVEEIAQEIDQSVANTSQHLQQLLRAGLVRTRRDGNRVNYQLAGPRVAELWALLRDVAAEHHAEVERLAAAYLGDRSQLETISRAELRRRLGRKNVIVLDVRPTREYEAGHVAGARSVPIDELARRSATCPRCRDRRLLPWPLLRLRRRRGPHPAPTRPQGCPPRRRLPRMGPRRTPHRRRCLMNRRRRSTWTTRRPRRSTRA